MGQLWVVRAGEGGKLAERFLQQGQVTLFFNDTATEDLSAYDEAGLRALLKDRPNKNASTQLVRFAFSAALTTRSQQRKWDDIRLQAQRC